MERPHKNLRDVGVALQWLRSNPEGAFATPSSEPPFLKCGALLRCGLIDGCSSETLRRPGTIVNLRMGPDDSIHESIAANGVEHLHIPAANDLEKYDTSNPDVKAWLTEVVRIFEREDLKLPVLIHCRSGKDRTGVVVAAILSILKVPEKQIVQEFLLSEETDEKNIRLSLAGFKKAGGIASYFTLDLAAIRAQFHCSDGGDIRWLQQDVELMCRLARAALKPPAEHDEAIFWQESVVQASTVLAARAAPAEAAVALYYQGMSLSHLQRYETAHTVLAVGEALARAGQAKPQVLQRLEKERATLPDAESEPTVLEVEEATNMPGDPHASWVILSVVSEPPSWRATCCPPAFSWLRCGELAASATPSAQHLPALNALSVDRRVSADQVGAPRPAQEHFEDVVGQVAKELACGSGCLLHCNGGFGTVCVALGCFLVSHGLDEAVSTKPGQPSMTGSEAIAVLRSLRPGSLAEAHEEDQVLEYAQAAWGKQVQKMQQAFAGSVSATQSSASQKSAPSSAKVVKQPGDGNCLFHSMAYGIGGVNAATLRQDICRFMERNPSLSIAGTSLAEWIQMLSGSPVDKYCKNMAKSAQWGGAPEIAACSHLKQMNIHVYERRGSGFELTVPFDVGSSRTVNVLYVGGVHYDALVL